MPTISPGAQASGRRRRRPRRVPVSVAKRHRQAADLAAPARRRVAGVRCGSWSRGHWRLAFGSSASRRLSPNTLNASASTMIARPGRTAAHGARAANCCAVASIVPRLGVGRLDAEPEEGQHRLAEDGGGDRHGRLHEDHRGGVGQHVPAPAPTGRSRRRRPPRRRSRATSAAACPSGRPGSRRGSARCRWPSRRCRGSRRGWPRGRPPG